MSAIFHGQTVDIYENFEDSTLESGLAIEENNAGATTIPSADYYIEGIHSCRQRRNADDYDNVTYYPSAEHGAHISAGFWWRCPTLADGGHSGIAAFYSYFLTEVARSGSTYTLKVTSLQGGTWTDYTVEVADGSWYWIAYRFVYVTSCVTNVRVYNATHSQILDQTYAYTGYTKVDEMMLGQESNDSPGTGYVYYDAYVIDYTNYAFPLLGWDTGGGSSLPVAMQIAEHHRRIQKAA